jgi:hypothetical protein
MVVWNWKLEFSSGQVLVVDAPPLARLKQVQAYYQILRSGLVGLPAWGISEDNNLFPIFSDCYTAIANLLRPSFNPAYLTQESRHRFFVATDPTETEKGLILGLSGLEYLLGLSPHEEDTPKPQSISPLAPPIPTSGEVEIDIWADLLLLFPDTGMQLARIFPLQVLSKLIRQSSDRQRGESAIKELQQQRDRELFEKNATAIDDQFKQMGVVPPW